MVKDFLRAAHSRLLNLPWNRKAWSRESRLTSAEMRSVAWSSIVKQVDEAKLEPRHVGMVSSVCRQRDFSQDIYQYWCTAIHETPRFHRKQWEFVFICQALWERGMLRTGARGLGFGVGREPLPALFASHGCQIVATDLPAPEAHAKGWARTQQYSSLVTELNERAICPADAFRERVRFEAVDMNHIPHELRDFDFCWSSCALEHLGSIGHGARFVESSLRCLKPGGVAVHTTEHNLWSNDHTIDNAPTVLFRRRDLEELAARLRRAGHDVAPLDLDPGEEVLDRYLDVPPYRAEPHLKVAMQRHVATSAGIIIRKAA